MPIVSFESIHYQSGVAKIIKSKVENNVVTIWFELENGMIIKENYHMGYQSAKNRLKAAVEAVIGSKINGDFDLAKIGGMPCYVKIEERPWGDQTWTGVKEVLAVKPEIEPEYECEPESEYKQPLQSTGLIKKVVPRQGKILQKQKPVEESAIDNQSSGEAEMPLGQPARKYPLSSDGTGGSGNPRRRPIGRSFKAEEMLEDI